MLKSVATRWVFLGLVAFGLLATPSPSLAGPFDWLCPWHRTPSSSQQATTYAPPYSPSPTATPAMVSYGSTAGCNTCVSQTCNYTPQTAYRWTYSRIKRMSYKPVVGCDPCSGQQVTTYRPVESKTFLPWLHQVPVTTYKLACPPTSGATGWSACNTCSTGYVLPGSGSSCASCVGGSGVTNGSAWQADSSYSSPPPRTYAPGPVDAEGRGAQKPPAQEDDLQPEPDPGIGPASARSRGPELNAPKRSSGPIAIRSTMAESGLRTVSFETPSLEAPAPMTPFGPDAQRRMEENFRRATGK